ncbi:MAG: PadR family transcriptional regulator [Acidobacteria bacterium]|nr:MAG: PadR family transcriptional regulator [Acidobacteriota bacterium]
MTKTTDLLPGTLDLLILNTLALQSRHGVGVADRLAQLTRGTFQVGPGSLFTSLHRMEARGWLASEWSTTEEGRRAKFYRLTASGRRQLQQETARWKTISGAVNQALALPQE